MTEQQTKRVESFKRRVSVKGTMELTAPMLVHDSRCIENEGFVSIGWERSRDGRDMTTVIDLAGRTVYTRPTYSYR